MSIGLGIIASDGVVLAADSEIGSGGDFKGVDQKLAGAISETAGQLPKLIGLAGAGSFNYYQSIRLEVIALIASELGNDQQSDSRIKNGLESFMIDFHSKHVIPYLKTKCPPAVCVLVGTWIDGRGGLWATDMSTVRPHTFGYEAIGIGATPAINLLHGYLEGAQGIQMSIESAALLACYVVQRSKCEVEGVGQSTNIIILGSGGIHFVPRELILDCERVFDQNYTAFQSEAFYYVSGMRSPLDRTELELARKNLDGLRQSIRAIISETPHT